MSRNAKIGIAVVIGIVIGCLCLCAAGAFAFSAFSGAVTSSQGVGGSDKARARAAEIVDYALPAGFSEAAAFSLLGADMALISSDSGVLILLMQVDSPELMQDEDLRRQLETQIRQAMQAQRVEWELVEQQTETIRGQEVGVTIYEGEQDSGGKLRQLITAPFNGKSGMVMISIIGEVERWSQQDIGAFLSSIK